jgi:hypothetical protein
MGGVGQEIGVEAGDDQREECSAGAEKLARGEEDDERQADGEDAGHHAHPKDQALAAPVIAGEPVAAVDIGLTFEKSALEWRRPEVPADRGDGGKKLDQRRMLRIEAVVARLPHHVAGKGVVALVEG